MDIGLIIPKSPLQAIMPNEVWRELYQQLNQLVLDHRTILILKVRKIVTLRLHNLRQILRFYADGSDVGHL